MSRSSQNTRRRGSTLMYGVVMMTALCAFVSLGVDLGRVQLVKTELQRAADAAARYGTTGITSGLSTVQTLAIDAANDNTADGTPVVLQNSDVEMGNWNETTRVFVSSGTPVNSVRVTARRTDARGNAVPLMFARVLGRTSCDVSAVSVAELSSLSAPSWDLAATGGVTMGLSSNIHRRSTEAGSLSLASNGAWSMTGASSISGNALYRNAIPIGNISGSKVPMSSDLTFKALSPPAGAASLGDVVLGGTTQMTVTAGTYYANNITLTNSAKININSSGGPVKVYCAGNFTVTSSAAIFTNGYSNRVEIYMTGWNTTIDISGTTSMTALIYAPSSTMNLRNSVQLFGSFVVKNLSMTDTSSFEYSSTLAQSGGSGGTATNLIESVK